MYPQTKDKEQCAGLQKKRLCPQAQTRMQRPEALSVGSPEASPS